MSTNRLPDFLVIGSMKSGTTTLFDYLASHPRIFMCTPKEPRFFSLDDRYSKGLDWYSSLFTQARSDQLVGEASTCYSRWPHHPHVVTRISEHLPDTRFIYIMRDPVTRIYSHYKHRMEERVLTGMDLISFSQAKDLDPEMTDTGMYAMQIGKYFEKFGRDRFHFIVFEELVRDPETALRGLFAFLGIPNANVLRTRKKSNESGTALASHRIDDTLRKIRRAALLSPVVDILPPAARRAIFRSARWVGTNSPFRNSIVSQLQSRIPPYTAQDRADVAALYRDANKELENLLGRKINCWTR